MLKFFTSAIAALAMMAAPAVAEGHDQAFGGYNLGAMAMSGGMSYSSVENANGRAEFESYSGAQQTSFARFSPNGQRITVETSGFDASGSMGLIRGAGEGFTEAGAIRGGYAMGGSSFSGSLGNGGFNGGGFDGDDDDDDDDEGGNCGNGNGNGNAQNCP